MRMPILLEMAICVLSFCIIFIMPAFVLGAVAKSALAPMLAQEGIVPGDNWYWGVVGGISLALLLGWSLALAAFLRRTGFFGESSEARCERANEGEGVS